MSMVVAVKVLADAGVAALRGFGDLSREEAASLLPMWEQMRKLRQLDEATAVEVTGLILGRFTPAEPPNVAGVDFLPVRDDWENDFSNCPRCTRPRANSWTDHCDTCDGPLVEVVRQPTAEAVDRG
jgi:hypothetical protein